MPKLLVRPELALLLCLAGFLPAQTLVRDIRSGAADPSPGTTWMNFHRLGNRAVFFATDEVHGLEPRITDGTPQGTTLVLDVMPGSAAGVSDPYSPYAWNGAVYFAGNSERGYGLWRTDGTPGGTYPLRLGLSILANDVATFVPGPGGLYFAAISSDTGGELWRTDGTPAGTVLVADVNPGPAHAMQLSISPVSICAIGGTVYFVADDGATGHEIWRTDGTAANTWRVVDLANGATSSAPRTLTNLNGSLLFSAYFGGQPRQWWISDGTAGGTTFVSPVTVIGDGPRSVFVHNGKAIFPGLGTGTEPWVTDGTPQGTMQLADIYAGSGYSAPTGFTLFANEVWFTARSSSYGYELWHTDMTPAGTAVVDVIPGPLGLSPTGMVDVAGMLWFAGTTTNEGTELWRSDGTIAGTSLIADIRPGSAGSYPMGLVALQNSVVFAANDGVHGNEPFVSGGSAASTSLLADFAKTTSGAAIPSFTSLRGKAYFAANDGISGLEPWVSDGTPAGTRLLKDTQPGANSSAVGKFVAWRDAVWFSANNRLWRSDGTPAGTVSPIATTIGAELVATDDALYFAGPQLGLWRSDGTPAGTSLVVAFGSAFRSQPPTHLIAHQNRVYFAAAFGVFSGSGIYCSDGTAAGTLLVQPILSSIGPLPVREVVATSSDVFYTVAEGAMLTLYGLRGTSSQALYADSASGILFVLPDLGLSALGARVYFAGSDASNGRELWSSDGTPAGTARLVDIQPGAGSSRPRNFVAARDRLFFAADDGTLGDELWVSDGTPAGTRLVADLLPGFGGSGPTKLFAAGDGGQVVFRANGPLGGPEPWVSDGTSAGTVLLADIAPAGSGSAASFGAVAGTTLLFRANDGNTGEELHGVPLRNFGGALARPYGTACPGTAGRLPRIGAAGLPLLGNAGFAATLRDALPNSSAALVVGLRTAQIPLAGGCTLWVDSAIVFLGANTDALGTASVSLAVPPTPALLGGELAHQFAIADPQGGFLGGLALSDALLELVGQ
ncbi:MAG: hypothetical protein IT457_16810 [Planctomycetes bacterium]|nr:hypothetical protein [Planctomycetota bacterium]